MVRLNLFNKGLFCGNQAIQWEMNDMEIQPIPSLSTIGLRSGGLAAIPGQFPPGSSCQPRTVVPLASVAAP